MSKKILVSALLAVGVAFGAMTWVANAKDMGTPTTSTAPAACCAMHDTLVKALDDATKAVEAGNKDAALAAIKKAKDAVNACPKMKGKCPMMSGTCSPTMGGATTEPAAFINTKCPIMGGKIDPAKVTPALTREYKGQKIAFCCSDCPAAWDKLTDAQKDEKLKEAK